MILVAVAVVCWTVTMCGNDLDKARTRYEEGTQERSAAEFLLDNMDGLYAYGGRESGKFDSVFRLFEQCREAGDDDVEPAQVVKLWEDIVKERGNIDYGKLEKRYDKSHLTAEQIVRNIETALDAWRTAPDSLVKKDFRMFLEYVLPYRVGTEKIAVEDRGRLYEEYRGMRDTLLKDMASLPKVMNDVLRWQQGYRASKLMWGCPLSMSVEQMQQARRGACLHLCEYYVSVLRAIGIPATIDFVDLWGNRSGGHCWVVAFRKSASQMAMDALEGKELEMTYKPSKVFRRTFKKQAVDMEAVGYVPQAMLDVRRVDVTHKYCRTHDITVSGDRKVTDRYNDVPYGVICTFDNQQWTPAWYGKVKGGRFTFKNMADSIYYRAGYLIDGKFVAATEPFMVDCNGKIHTIEPQQDTQAMTLRRKYPRYPRMDLFAIYLIHSTIEGSVNGNPEQTYTLYEVQELPGDVNDIVLESKRKYNSIIWRLMDYSTGNLAEVEFYGRRTPNGPEEKLTGKVIGKPDVAAADGTGTFRQAMDGNPETFFSKPKKEEGYVGLDLGKGNEYYITRVHFHPRSDTNYILKGDTYELFYWQRGRWVSAGSKKATEHELTFVNVPKGTLYILRDNTRGTEDRPFTFENERQIWW